MICLNTMEKPARLSQNSNSLRVMLPAQKSLRRLSGRCSPKVGGQHASPTVFPEKRGKIKASKQNPSNNTAEVLDKTKAQEHRIDIGDEQSDLLGYEIFCGKLVLDKKVNDTTDAQAESKNQVAVDGKLTSKALIWGTHMLHLKDVISVSSQGQNSCISLHLCCLVIPFIIIDRYLTMLVCDILLYIHTPFKRELVDFHAF